MLRTSSNESNETNETNEIHETNETYESIKNNKNARVNINISTLFFKIPAKINYNPFVVKVMLIILYDLIKYGKNVSKSLFNHIIYIITK